MKRASYKKEPKLKVHRYVVRCGLVVGGKWRWKYHYLMTLKEVKELRAIHKIRRDRCQRNAAHIIEVFSAVHNFLEVWENH
jgi:hypothetical protein